jgi:cell division protein FtsI/penicillin-binding protein 2
VKPLFVGAAVDAGLARMDESIDCEHGAWTHHWGRGRRTGHEKTGGHGVLSMTKVISLSDNIAMAKLGVRLGPERLRAWTDAFGFGGRIGIDLPGEDAGLLPGPKAWNPLDACMSIPMGHAMAVTPLQLAMAHAAIANGGVWLPPKLVRRAWTNSAAGEQPVVLEAGPAPRRLLRAETAAAIQLAMTHTMLEGTAKRSQLQGYSSAGKTGTAEKLINGRYADHLNVGSFVCWAPATPGVRPEALCLVVVDAPTRNGRFGADTAAPVVQRVLQRTLEHLAVPQTEQPVAESGRRRPARGQR